MFNPLPLSGPAVRKAILLLVPALLAGLPAATLAQTAPQLLPYTAKLIAGGGTAAIASGGTCPVSGFISTDAYGDGCLATEIQLVAPRYATADSSGAIFFSDFTNGLVRRVDPVTGVVTAVAGGAASSPAAGATCGTHASTDALGDGCLATAVQVIHPVGLAFSPAGDLYFADVYYTTSKTGEANVRKIAATAGVITTTGVISLVAGNVSQTKGYAANSPAGNIVAATGSYLYSPYDVAFDSAGNLYIAENYEEAVLVVNTNATTTTTVTGVTIPPGTVAKILGAYSATNPVCPNGAASGCSYGLATVNSPANASEIDAPYAVTFDPAGNVYVASEYYNFIAKISATGTLTDYAGIQNAAAKKLQRGAAGSFGVGSSFGVAADANSNVYFTDASQGVVWRVDGAGQSQYVVAGGATTVCSTVVDAYGDGCPATKATFGATGTSLYATTASPGIFGINVDTNSNLYVGDTITNVIREVASGTQFGAIGELQATTQTVDVHFASSDLPGAVPYTITAGSAVFTVGTAACTTNSDATTDCLVPLTATPTALGAFTGTLQVKSSLGTTASFPLSGIAVMSPATRISVSVASTTNCTGTAVFPLPAPVTLTATIVSSGSPTGTVTFFANGTQIGTPQTVSKGAASLSYAFTTASTFVITASYSGDSYYNKATSPATVSVITSTPLFTLTLAASQPPPVTVSAGQTALYGFTVAQNVYTGTISMACSGLPANSSCSFSPSSIVATGCSTTSTVALSIVTQQGAFPSSGASLAAGGRGWFSVLSMVAGFGLALLIGLRRRAVPRSGHLWMVFALLLGASGMLACGGQFEGGPATPAGMYALTVTATGTTGATSSFPISLTVTK